ncbi:hypothetical protein D3C76_1684870 [compost metagenome]
MIFQFITEVIEIPGSKMFACFLTLAVNPQVTVSVLLVFLMGHRNIAMQQIAANFQIFMHCTNPAEIPIPSHQSIPSQTVGNLPIWSE